jgi:hypothetical protein
MIFTRDKTLDEHELATYSKTFQLLSPGTRLRLSLFTVSTKTWKALPQQES